MRLYAGKCGFSIDKDENYTNRFFDRGEEPFHAARFRHNHNNMLKKSEPVSGQEQWVRIILLAPQVGLEPTTTRLTAECSAIELLRNMESGGDLCSRAVSSQVRSALRGLTSVFGMGTGGTLSSLPPEMVSCSLAGRGDCLSFPRFSPHPDNCTAMILTDRFQLVSLGLCVKSSPRPISIIKLHPLPNFHR